MFCLRQAQLKRESKQGAGAQDDLNAQLASLQSQMEAADKVMHRVVFQDHPLLLFRIDPCVLVS